MTLPPFAEMIAHPDAVIGTQILDLRYDAKDFDVMML